MPKQNFDFPPSMKCSKMKRIFVEPSQMIKEASDVIGTLKSVLDEGSKNKF